MPIAPFPHRYLVTLEEHDLTATPRVPIRIGPPPQFGGTDAVWSPEQLLVGAAMSCLQTTFAAYARRANLVVGHWRSVGTGILDKGPGGPTFREILIEVEVDAGPGEHDRVLEVLRNAEHDCIVSRALSCPVRLSILGAAPALVQVL